MKHVPVITFLSLSLPVLARDPQAPTLKNIFLEKLRTTLPARASHGQATRRDTRQNLQVLSPKRAAPRQNQTSQIQKTAWILRPVATR